MSARARGVAVVVLVAAAGCPKQVSAPAPSATLSLVGGGGVGERIVLGEQLEVGGSWYGECADWEPSKGEYRGSRPCHERDFTLHVTCEGPCTVDGAQVTPTAPGAITVHVELVRPERTYRDARRVEVVAAEGFWVAGCGNLAVRDGAPELQKPILADDVRCVLGERSLELGVLAGGEPYRIAVSLDGGAPTSGIDRASLAQLLGLPSLAPGVYPLTLGYHGLSRRLAVELR